MDIKDMDKLISDLKELKRIKSEMTKGTDSVKSKITGLESILKEALESLDKTEYSCEHGTVKLYPKSSVKLPETEEDQEAFYNWLKEQGLYDSVLTVPSAALNKIYKEHLEKSQDDNFEIPGIQDCKIFNILKYYTKKK